MDVTTITTVVATKQSADFLAEALSSIEAQTRPTDELLVIDAGSTDGTKEIASAAHARVLVQSEPGLPAAYNEAITAARSDLVAFCSSDDRWCADKLALQARLLASGTHDAVVGHVRFFLDVAPGEAAPAGLRPELLDGDRPALIMETLLAPRSVFALVGPFDTTLALAHDVDWFTRARELGVRIGVVPRVVVEKRIHGSNTSFDVARNDGELLRVVRAALRRRHGPDNERT